MSESNSKIEKIQKSSKTALLVINIAKIFCIACAVIAIVVGCIVIGMRTQFGHEFQTAIDEGTIVREDIMNFAKIGVDYEKFMEGKLADSEIGIVLGTYILTIGIVSICMAVVLHFVSKVFKDFCKSYSPFQPGIIKNLKITFVLRTVFVLKSSLLIGAIVGLAAWCVINIFEYGCELQKQSDETL